MVGVRTETRLASLAAVAMRLFALTGVLAAVSCGGGDATEAPQIPALSVATPSPLPGGTQGEAYSQQLSASGGTGSYAWSTVSGSWPPGITLSSGGAVSGTPTGNGVFTATVRVTSGQQTADRQFELTIAPPPLSITTASPLPNGTQGTAYSQQLGASGGIGSYGWSLVSGSWPPGITLSSGGLVSGTPTGYGAFTVTVRVTSGQQTADRQYQLTIAPPALSITTSSPLPDGAQGTAYSQQLSASGGTGSYSWSTLSGNWPPGITLASGGLVSGTPTGYGAFTVTVRVTSGQQTADRQYQLTIAAPALSITTTSPLPNGTQGTAYSQQLSASGGTGSYSWSTLDGSWPSGITLASGGLVSGTPTGNGTFTVTVRVTSGQQTADRQYQLTIAPNLGGGFGIEQFSLIPAGTFQMGSTNGGPEEQPVHTVTITKSFYLQKTEVTQGQWRQVMGSNPSQFNSCGDRCPVENVDWNDIQVFLQQLNAADPGKNYRLPTEAEWEYAARAGTTGDYGGTGIVDDMAWYNMNSQNRTWPVAQKRANAWGLYDMHGNVFEWVQDWYSATYYSVSPASDPPGPPTGFWKVFRGGSWNNDASAVRSARRVEREVTYKWNNIGFRLARTQ